MLESICFYFTMLIIHLTLSAKLTIRNVFEYVCFALLRKTQFEHHF